MDHSGVVVSIENLEKEQIEQAKEILSAHKRIDGIKNWVIAGMSSLIIQLIMFVFGFLFVYLKVK